MANQNSQGKQSNQNVDREDQDQQGKKEAAGNTEPKKETSAKKTNQDDDEERDADNQHQAPKNRLGRTE